jgi:O-antigen/teichoic acid export membrane protein
MSLQLIARNTFALLSANVISAAAGFAVNVLLVRYLGVEGIGRYTYITTYAALFGILSNFGLYLMLTREIAAEPQEASARLGAVLMVQALLAPLALAVTAGTALLFHPAAEVTALAVAAVGTILASLAGPYGAVVTGREKIHLNAAVSVGMAGLWGLLVLVLVALRLGVFSLVVLFALHKLANLVVLRLVCRRACAVSPRYELRGLPVRRMLAVAAPFALMIVLNDFYWNVGTILLGRLRGAEEVGMFAAAYRVIAVLVALVGTCSGVLYPRFSYLYATNPEGFASLVGSTRKYALAIGLPLGLAISVLADPIVRLLFGAEFRAAGGSLQILGLFVPLCCIYSPLSSAMLAMGLERRWLALMTAATGVVIGGSAALSPALGHIGVAGAVLGSGVLLGVAVPLAIGARGVSVDLTSADLKVVGALVTMGLVLWQLRGVPALALITSCAVYVAILYRSGFVTAEERLSLRTSLAMERGS